MLLLDNSTTVSDGRLDEDVNRPMIDAKDYADFLQYVNSFNWSGVADVVDAIEDPFANFVGGLDGSSAIALDPASFWLNFSGHFPTVSDSSSILNASAVDTAINSSTADWIWEAGKLRIPLYSIIFLLGITGNVLVILTILQNTRMRTVTNMFLLNLAISDLLLGVFCMPFTLIGQLLRDFIFGDVFCRLISFFQAVSVSVSGWTLVAISVERFYAICHPLTSRKWQTRSHARYIILAVWLGSLAIMSPVAVLSQLKPVGNDGRRKCREVWPDDTLEKTFTVFLDVILLIIPLFLMVAMYGMIVNHLWKVDQGGGGEESEAAMSVTARNTSANRNSISQSERLTSSALTVNVNGNGSSTSRAGIYRGNKRATVSGSTAGLPATPSLRRCNPEHCLKTKRRVLKMLIVVVLEFFICWTPLYVVNTMSFFAPRALYEGLGYTGISLMQLLAQASCCCNPITYCFMSSSFRRAFVKAFGCSKVENFSRSVGTV